MILLRHGQSEFNLAFTTTRRDPGIADPKLTPLGHAQAARAAEALAGEPIRRIIVSPYTRALQTGAARTRLVLNWPEHDFAALDEVWWPPVEEPTQSVIGRAALFRAEMAALPDWSDTLVVSHWGFILCLTGISAANGEWLRCDPTGPAPGTVVWHP